MKSLFVKKSFTFLVFFASQFFCFAAGKNVKQLVPKEVTPVEYRNIYLNWNNEGTPQFFSYEDLQNDVNALNYLISTAYAGYEDAVKRGLNLETFAEQVDDYYYSYDRISTDDYIHTLTNFLEKKMKMVEPYNTENLGKYRYTEIAEQFIHYQKKYDTTNTLIAIICQDDVDFTIYQSYNMF